MCMLIYISFNFSYINYDLEFFFFCSSRRRHTRWPRDWSSDVCSSDLEPSEVADYVTEERNPGNVRRVARVEIRGRWPLLASGVVLVDTPGIGSLYGHNTAAARAALLDADGAVVVLSADDPVSEQERELLVVLAERRSPTYFVLNKADHLGAGDLDQVRRFVDEVICDQFGGKVHVFARQALRIALAGRGCDEDGVDFDQFAA